MIRDPQYDGILRDKYKFQGRYPGESLSEKEKKDLDLWEIIRFYERCIREKRKEQSNR